MREKGYDLFLVSDQHLDNCECRVCGSRCDVKRNLVGPMSWAGSLAGCKTKHDMFACPHSDEQWHDQALRLLKEVERTPSPTIEAIMRKDLKAIVKKGLRGKRP